MAWTGIYRLGDLPLTLAAGAAIAAWLFLRGERPAARRWLLAFGLALGTVGAAKIAYLGWATGIPVLRFNAPSGHAAGFAAVCPLLCHLAARGGPCAMRRLAAIASIAATLAVTAALVLARQHSPAEAAAGWLLGMLASLAAIHVLPPRPSHADGRALAASMLAFALCAGIAGSVPVGYLMIRMALVMSGNPRPHPWTHRTDPPIPSNRRQACATPPSFVSPGSDSASSTPVRPTRC